MTKCVIKSCKNSSSKLVKMKYFPKDPNRRKEWIKYCRVLGGMDNWTPNNHAALCEFHFSEDMWEEHNGKKKLKDNAVPTIFGEFVCQVKFSVEIDKTKITEDKKCQIINDKDIDECEMSGDLSERSIKSHQSDNQIRRRIIIKPQVQVKSVYVQDLPSPENSEIILDLGNERKTSDCEDVDTEDQLSDTELCSEEENLSDMQKELSVHSGNSDIFEKFKKLENMFIKSEKLRRVMKVNHAKKQKQFKNRIKKLEAKLYLIENSKKICNIFDTNQLALLNKEYKKMPKWCDSTLVKAYQLRFACGVSGYKELLKQKFPFPCLTTLHSKLQSWKFKSGDNDEIFQFLKIKVSQFKTNLDRDCLVVIDEMSITPGAQYDKSSDSYVGHITLPDHDPSELATHALVIMLVGISQRWEQVVDYFYISKNNDSRNYQSILLNIIIRKAYEIGLWVIGISCNVESFNEVVWSSFGINAERNSTVINKCKHPIDDNEYLYFLSGASHTFENLKEGIFSNSTVTISDDYVENNSLPVNVLQVQHFVELFKNMRIKSGSHLLSPKVSKTLQYLGEEQDKPEYVATSWLISGISKWFKILTARTPQLALSNTDTNKYSENINFLTEFVDLMSKLTFGSEPDWKPFQKEIIITTTSFLELSRFLIDERGHKFVLGDRLTHDYLENLFSELKGKNCSLDALQFRDNLKVITISLYLRRVSNSIRYETDSAETSTPAAEERDAQQQDQSEQQLPQQAD